MPSDDEKSPRRHAEREIRGIGIVAHVGCPRMLLDVEIMNGLQLHPQPLVKVLLTCDLSPEDGYEGSGVNTWIRIAGRKIREAVAQNLRAVARSEPIADFEFDTVSLERRLRADAGKGRVRHERTKVIDERRAIGRLGGAREFCICHGNTLGPTDAARRRRLPHKALFGWRFGA